jgi:hypothetical protein
MELRFLISRKMGELKVVVATCDINEGIINPNVLLENDNSV